MRSARTWDQRPRARLSDFVPTMYIGPLEGLPDVHLLTDASLGYCWSAAVPALEAVDAGEALAEEACDRLLRAVGEGGCLDLLVHRGRDVREVLRGYVRRCAGATDPFAASIASQLSRRWEEARVHGFFPAHGDLNFFPRSQSIRLFLKSAPQKLWLGAHMSELAAAFGGRLERRLGREVGRMAAAFRQDVRRLEQTAAEAGLALHRLDAPGYVDWLGELLFPQREDRPMPRVDHRLQHSPAEAVAQLGDIPSMDRGGFVTEYRGVRVWHMAVAMSWQGTVGPGMLAAITDSERDMTVCLSYRASSRMKTLFMLKTRQHVNRKSSLPFNRVETEETDESLSEAQRRMFQGENAGSVRLIVWVRGSSSAEASDQANRVLSVLDRYMPAEIETRIGSSLLLSALPGARNPISDAAQARSRRMMSADAAALAPIAGYWQGIDAERSLALYVSRWGTPLHLDPRVCDRNPHFLVVGGSGSGKSFWVHDYLIQLYRLPDVWTCLMSVKPDYERLARLLGQYVELDLDGAHCISPFGGEPTHDNCAMWVAILALMLSDGDERLLVDKTAEALLGEAVLAAARAHWNHRTAQAIRETLLADIVKRLEHTALGRELAARLQPYVTGPYSRLFNRANTLRISSRFVFFNLANVVNYSCAAAVTLCLFSYVHSVMTDPRRLAHQKVLGLDEGWALMRGPASAELVEKAFRAYRSFNGMAFAVSQLLSDFDTAVGRAVLANTATKFVLPQEESSLAELPKYLELSDRERELLRTLRLRKGFFGEFLVKVQGHASTVGRVVPDPLKYAISTTDPADCARFNALLAESPSDYRMACERFASRYPYGRAAA